MSLRRSIGRRFFLGTIWFGTAFPNVGKSLGGKIRVFPAAPKRWPDVAFYHLRTQGAFLVTAKRKAGVTEFVRVESTLGGPCIVHTDIANPSIYVNDTVVLREQAQANEDGGYRLELAKGDTATFCRRPIEETDFEIVPIPVDKADRNLFGLSKKTERLPGHGHYNKKSRR